MPKGGAVGSEYHRALLKARNKGHTLGRKAVQKLNRSLRDALKRIDDGSDNPITRARAAAMRSQITGILEKFEALAVKETADTVRLTVTQTVKIHQATVESLIERFAKRQTNLSERFDVVAARAMSALASREKNAALFKTLMRRNVREAAPALDTLLQGAVTRGVSQRKLAKDVAEILGGDFPSLQDYGLRKTELAGLRTVASDARRIALSETNNAMREANRMALHQSPIALAAKWQLSGNHAEEDECDELATAENGFGPGFWPLNEWPVAPHPNCGCYAGEVFFRPIEQWADPKVYAGAA